VNLVHKYLATARRALVAMVTLACVATGGVALGAGQAAAGTNGQHVHIYAHHGDGFGSAQIHGTDQNGNHVDSPKLHLEHGKTPWTKDRDMADSNQWWKGTIAIDWFNWATGEYITSSTCEVPTSQWSNWKDCWNR
jgi:hypothetical protein